MVIKLLNKLIKNITNQFDMISDILIKSNDEELSKID
jgi:hypothetical protein